MANLSKCLSDGITTKNGLVENNDDEGMNNNREANNSEVEPPLTTRSHSAQMETNETGGFLPQGQFGSFLNQNYILNTTLPAEMEFPQLLMQEMINNNNLLKFSELPEEKLIVEDYGDLEPMNVRIVCVRINLRNTTKRSPVP